MLTPPPEVDARTRSYRLSTGKCPHHGGTLVYKEALLENGVGVGRTYGCTDTSCTFTADARIGTRLDKLLHR